MIETVERFTAVPEKVKNQTELLPITSVPTIRGANALTL
jgi:hypothetical protein